MPLISEADALYVGDRALDALYAGIIRLWPTLEWGSQERMLTNAEAITYTGPGTYNLGARFTVTADGRITHVRYWHTGGCAPGTTHTVSIWTTSDRVQQVAQVDASGSGPAASAWREIELTTPFLVSAGVSYTVAVTTDNSWYAHSPEVASIAPHLINLQGMYAQGGAFPEIPSGVTYHVDVVYQQRTGTAPEQPWSPSDIPGLVTWIDAAEVPLVDGAPVNTLIDLTGRRFDAYAYLNPSPVAPVMRASAADGKPCIEFQGTSGLMSASAFLGVAGLTFIAVGRIVGTSDYAMLVTRGSMVGGEYSPRTYEMRLSASTTAFQCIGDYSAGGPTWSSTFLHTLGVDYLDWMDWEPSVASRLFVNGTDQGAGHAVSVVDEGGDISIGSRMDGFYWSGLVREVLVYNRALTADERLQVQAHLMEKYALSPLD